ncbi:MAG: DUF1553 domain-containing protein [Planctomycetes bacterium]|nr:DUF1553 domain-containing protein [Planctomycetota bacterium]
MRLSLLLSFIFAALSIPAVGGEGAGSADFLEDIRPILAGKCFPCHGPDKARRKGKLRLDTSAGIFSRGSSGSAVVAPGKAEESLLIEKIESTDEEEIMPPKDSGLELAPAEVSILRAWVNSGAEWKGHWAYRKPVRPSLPQVKDAAWIRNPVDAFVLARLERAKLRPAPAAGGTTLLRRLWIDLTGLPPEPDDVRRYLEDSGAEAWDKAVDRLLASPHFGERSAQSWLDAARYSDTTGYAADKPREMWVYRQWVIDALNADMPFDQFTIEQLAGDMLPGSTASQKVASGFHRNSMQALGNNPRKEEFRVKGVVDRVNTTGRVWLGTSLECAECHDHKYDPFSQRDYYRVFALFNNIPHYGEGYGVYGPRMKVPLPGQQASLDALSARETFLKELEARRLRELADVSYDPEKARELVSKAPGARAAWRLSGSLDATSRAGGRLQLYGGAPKWIQGPASLPGQAIELDGRSALQAGKDERLDLTGSFTIAAWVRTRSAVADIVSRYDWVAGQRSFVFGIGGEGDKNGSPGHLFAWVSASAAAWNGGQVHSSFPINDGQWHHVAAVFDAGKSFKLFIDGELDAKAKLVDKIPGEVAVSSRRLAIGAGYTNSEHPDEFFLKGSIADVRLYSRAFETMEGLLAPAARVLAALNKQAELRDEGERALVRDFSQSADRKLQEIRAELSAIPARVKKLKGTEVTAQVMVEGKERRKTHIHVRGDFRAKGSEVKPGIPELFRGNGTREPGDRLAFARWLVGAENPLVARVTVNRIWQRYFGYGLVRTTGDFGLRGDAPTHPELLDWLACEFVDSGWDLKRIHRLIVSSETYRQSSSCTPARRESDPFNSLLGRSARFRLQAEQIRDLSLSAAGLLGRRIGGASVFPVQPGDYWSEKGQEKDSGKWLTSKGRDLYRRGLYTYWKRMALYPSFWILDAPTRQVCTVSRGITNTPIQTLVTLNDPVFFEAARAFAIRILREVPGGVGKRVEEAFLIALSRLPSTAESEAFSSMLGDLARRYREDPQAAASVNPGTGKTPAGAELAAWTLLASTLLNLDEALTRE